MSELTNSTNLTNRRDVLKVLALAPLAALAWTREEEDVAATRVAKLPLDAQQAPAFFSAQEWRTVHVLVDDIFPRDDSGSATDAKVPEFMDFILNDGNQNNRTNMRNGLTWLDQESQKRFAKGYADAAPTDRHLILDDIAWPAKAKAEFRANVTWFNSFRNLTAAGYFSSRVGYKAIGYTGGVANPKWMGSSPAIMQKLGLTYDEWDKKYGRGY
jgi:hypothetical protein